MFVPCLVRCLFYFSLHASVFHYFFSESRAFVAELPVVVSQRHHNRVVV